MSINPDSYIINSELASMGEYGSQSTSITLPGSMSVGGGYVWSNSVDMSLSGSGHLRVRIASSKIVGESLPANRIQVFRQWSGGPANVILGTSISVFRLNPTTVRVTISVFNPQSFTLTSPSGNEVFTITAHEVAMPF